MGRTGEKRGIYGVLLDRPRQRDREREMEYIGIHKKEILKLHI